LTREWYLDFFRGVALDFRKKVIDPAGKKANSYRRVFGPARISEIAFGSLGPNPVVSLESPTRSLEDA
jgi:hypothetical protein